MGEYKKGTVACFANVVPSGVVKSVVGEEMYAVYGAALDALLGSSFYRTFEGVYEENCEHSYDDKEFIDLYHEIMKIREKFHKETGITIRLYHHDSGLVGDIYDGVDGWYWAADTWDVYVTTPAVADLRRRFGDDAVGFAGFTIYDDKFPEPPF